MSQPKRTSSLWLLCLLALGVVYGDIGTSVLYAVHEIFFPKSNHGIPISRENVLGAMSLVLLALNTIICLKYIVFVLRADHHGEGGMFALLSKIHGKRLSIGRISVAPLLVGLLILASGLLIGDGAITPAISVMGAVEGLTVITPIFKPYVVPITIVILLGLFWFQARGTAGVGRVFGPVVLFWLLAIGSIGTLSILETPDVLLALWPGYAVEFLWQHDLYTNLKVLGAIMLVITGGEALYADLGHFGKKPIRVSWVLVYIALTLNYLGQGAYLLSGRAITEGNIFFSMVPFGEIGLVLMVPLATLAAIIASQALITGLFSLIAQANALGLFPRVFTLHTSSTERGQIYQPSVNWVLCIGCILLVVQFQSASNLAAAYGLAVATVMLITSLALIPIAITEWRWSAWKATLLFGGFALMEGTFLVANSLKFTHGGWVPVVIGVVMFVLMRTWQWGRTAVAQAFQTFRRKELEWLFAIKEQLGDLRQALAERLYFAADLVRGSQTVVEIDRGIVFLSSQSISSGKDPIPIVLHIFLKRYGALPRYVTIFHVAMDPERPWVPANERYEVKNFGYGTHMVTAHYGFMEVRDVNIRKDLGILHAQGQIELNAEQWDIEGGEEEILIDKNLPTLLRWRARLYHLLLRFSTPAYRHFGLDGDAGLSKSLIPIRFMKTGTAVVEMPEYEGR